MTNEEFQKIVLEELRGLREGQESLKVGQKRLEERQKKLEERQKKLEERQKQLEERQKQLEVRQKSLELGQKEIKGELRAVVEQTADLTEFRQKVNKKFDNIIEDKKSIHEIIGEHEVTIRSIRRKIV